MSKGVALQWQFDHAPLLAQLNQLARTNFNQLGAEIGAYMIGQIQDRFDSQQLWDGSAMPESAAARARGGKTLIENHHLYDSYTWQPQAKGVAVGSASPYAAIHHFGGNAGRGGKSHIDPRPVLGVSRQDEEEIGNMILNAIGAA